jgi:outer membrane protein, adhesin transport system
MGHLCKMGRLLFQTALVFCAICLPAWGTPLEQVAAQMLATHPKLRVASANVRATQYDIDAAKAATAPKFSAIADPGISYGEGSRDAQGQKKTISSGDLGVRSTYLLFDGKRTDNDIARQEARSEVAQLRGVQTQTELINKVVEAYLEVLKQEKLEQLARDNLTEHDALRQKLQGIVDIDRGRQHDLAQVLARTAQAQVTLSTRQGSTQEAKSALADAAGGPVPTLEAVPDPQPALPPTAQAALEQLKEHPTLRAAQAEIAVAQRAANIAASWDKPRVDLQTTVNSPRNFEGTRKYMGNLDVRLAVQWQPFDGGAGKASSGSASELLNAARDGVDAAQRDLANEVMRHWSQIESRRGRGVSWTELVAKLEKVRSNHWQQFTIGKRSILDLLNTENETFQARLNAEQERLETLQSQYRLLGSTARTASFLGIPESRIFPVQSVGEGAP